MPTEHVTAIFLTELILLLLVGRLLGEGMSRIGQPAIFGQLLAGVLLGPSVFGALFPAWQHAVFPATPALKSMIDAVSQIGILLLLLLTGMETNLALVNRKRRAVISTSVSGIAVPFVCGVLLAYLLPDKLIPNPSARLVTALFLGTALSISSVKIVAMVLIEVGAIRRDLGQLILATAILDDTIAWIIIAVIAGIATQGGANLSHVAGSLLGTAVFLGLSLTVGRRIVAQIIRWSNDNMTTDVPVITAILIVMLTMALTTDLIGVHTALGAFVAGVLVGQSPILTEHIESQLKGFIIAFFSPVFFAVAGLGMDLRAIFDPTLLALTLCVIAAASVGKFAGALLGGRLGGLTRFESLALATALNARGSTEVIIASIGLSMGALSSQLYTMIVTMAVVTTMAMPPALRWILARVPLREEEAKRLEKEEAEEQDSVPRMERALVVFDDSTNGAFAGALAGRFAVNRQVMTTVMSRANVSNRPAGSPTPGPLDVQHMAASADSGAEVAKRFVASSTASNEAITKQTDGSRAAPPTLSLSELVTAKPAHTADAIEKEAAKGYSIVFVGIARPIAPDAQRFDDQLQRLVEMFDGPIAMTLNVARPLPSPDAPLDILVPTGGTADARLAIEIALALAKSNNGALTVLHVFDPQEDTDLLLGRARRKGMSILVDAHRLGKRSGVPVKGITVVASRPEWAIRRATRNHAYGLVVIGTAFRQGKTRFLGTRSSALIRVLEMPVLLVAR